LRLLNTTDDALSQIYNVALKIKELVIEASGKNEEERKTIQGQINELARNIKAIIKTAEYDGFNLLNGDYYIVNYGPKEDRFLVINANSAMEKSLYLTAEVGNRETDTVSLGFNNKENIPESGGSGGTQPGTQPTPIPSSGDATLLNPFTAQFKDAKIQLGAFGLFTFYEWQIKIETPHNKLTYYVSAPFHLLYRADNYTYDIETIGSGDSVKVKIIYEPTGEVVKGTVKYNEGGTLYYYPPGTDPKIYEYDSIDKKSYEISLSSVDSYPIQVASSYETLQRSLKNIETYLQKLDIVRGYYAAIENKLLNLQMANLLLRDNLKEIENRVKGVNLASAYGKLIMERFKSQITNFVLLEAFRINRLLINILR